MSEEMSSATTMESTANDSGSTGEGAGSGDSYWDSMAEADAKWGEVVNNDGSEIVSGGDKQTTAEAEKDEEPKPVEKVNPRPAPKAPATRAASVVPEKGYIASYFKDGESGKEFDVDTFTRDTIGDPRTAWKYAERQYTEAPATTEPPEDPTEKYYREEKEYRQRFRENFFNYRTVLDKYMRAGHDVYAADQLAMAEVERSINAHFEERDIRRRAQERHETLEQRDNGTRDSEIKSKARSNLNAVIQEHGGADKFTAFMQEGLDTINLLFDVSNPDHKGTKESTRQAINEWFERNIASDINKLRGLQQIIKGQVALKALPWAYKQGRTGAQKTAAQNARTTTRKPGGRAGGAPQGAAQRDTLDMYFDPTIDRNAVIDTV